jgi:5-methylthioribose kinase
MIRRVVGIAHVKDLDSIEPPEARAACEGAALAFGRSLLVGGAGAYATVEALVAAAEAARPAL